MKFRNHLLALFTILLLGTVSFLGGCATTGMDRSVKTSTSINDVDTEIRKMIMQIDVSGRSLDSLIIIGQPDLKKSFDTYSDNLVKLDNEGKRVIQRLDEMKINSREYFSEWEKQGDAFTNPQIRELSEERRSELAKIYAQVPAAGIGIKGTYHTYLTDLKEIQMFLSNDLTLKGVAAIDPVAKKSVLDREELKASLLPVISALDTIRAELYRSKK